MPLPILQPSADPNPETLVRLFHQTELNWARHLAEEEVLDVGTALFSQDLLHLKEANMILGAVLPDGVSPSDAIGVADSFYRGKGARLLGLIPSPLTGAEATRRYLSDSGWPVHRREILRLMRRPAASPMTVPSEIKIIPARASFRHARQLAEEMTACDGEKTEAAMLHYDDPHVDALLALRDGLPLASVSVLAMGEVGRIDQLYVGEQFRRQGLGKLMLSRALEICARALFKHVLTSTSNEEIAAQSLFKLFGFERIGEIDFFHRE